MENNIKQICGTKSGRGETIESGNAQLLLYTIQWQRRRDGEEKVNLC